MANRLEGLRTVLLQECYQIIKQTVWLSSYRLSTPAFYLSSKYLIQQSQFQLSVLSHSSTVLLRNTILENYIFHPLMELMKGVQEWLYSSVWQDYLVIISTSIMSHSMGILINSVISSFIYLHSLYYSQSKQMFVILVSITLEMQ